MKCGVGQLGGVTEFLLVLLGCCYSTDPGRRGKCGSAEKQRESRWDLRKFALTEAPNFGFTEAPNLRFIKSKLNFLWHNLYLCVHL